MIALFKNTFEQINQTESVDANGQNFAVLNSIVVS